MDKFLQNLLGLIILIFAKDNKHLLLGSFPSIRIIFSHKLT